MDTRNLNKSNSTGQQAGVLLILLGGIFMVATLGAGGLGWGTIWPAFIMAVGAAFIAQAFLGDGEPAKRAWPMTVGSFLLLLGGFFFTITLEVFSWGDHVPLWPLYLIMFGIALLVGYFASGFQKSGYLFTGLVFSLLGGILLPVTVSRLLYDFDWGRFSVIGTWFEEWFGTDWASTWWPLFLIGGGLLLLLIAALVNNPRVRGGFVFFGIVPLLLGAFFLATTLDIIPQDYQGKLWPIYLLIVSAGCLIAHFASDGEERLNLISGLVLGAVGLVFLPLSLVSDATIKLFWPLLLIAGGLLLLVPWMRGEGGKQIWRHR